MLGARFPFGSPTADGFPNPEETLELNKIEDELEAVLVETKVAVPVAVSSTNGMREFVFYAANEAAVRAAVERVRSATSHEVQMVIAPDPTWSVYQALRP